MTINEALNLGTKELKIAGLPSARMEARVLLMHFCELKTHEVMTHNDQKLNKDQEIKYFESIKKRATGVPYAYIIGTKEFFGRSFMVSPNVLIPRPETEELIEWILKERPTIDSLLDLCTGSGCIGITLALETNIKKLHLSDISDEALKICRANAGKLLENVNANIRFNISTNVIRTVTPRIIKSNLLQNKRIEKYDVIVSNPPYVLAEEYQSLMKEVKEYEPKLALIVENPEGFYTQLLEESKLHLLPNGCVYLETNPRLIDLTKSILEKTGFVNIIFKKDLSGKTRFIRGTHLQAINL